jgi:RNA polymerase sigma factor (TIGR02999 family)
MSEVTQVLDRVQSGDRKAAEELLPLVYQELRRLAAHKMANEAAGHTLQPTALVHEAWLRLTANEEVKWDGRVHFFAAAAEAMRRILIDNARRKHAVRHGGDQERVDIDAIEIPETEPGDDLLAINDALDRFAAVEAQKAELVKLRYFVGMTLGEAASVLGISEPTAKRWWAYAKAWLLTEMRNSAQNPKPCKP